MIVEELTIPAENIIPAYFQRGFVADQQETLSDREERLREGQFVSLNHSQMLAESAGWSPQASTYPKPWLYEALAAAEAGDVVKLATELDKLRRELADALRLPLHAGWGLPKLEIELDNWNGPYVWLKINLAHKAIRTAAADFSLAEAVRLTGYLRQFALEAHWNACQRFGTFCYDVRSIAVPYKKARGEEATHILLYYWGHLYGHLPATGTAKKQLDAAQKMYEEIEACYAAKEFERTGVRYDAVCG